MDYKKFNKAVDLDGLKKDIEEAKDSTYEGGEIPSGKYEVGIEKLELSESKAGNVMVVAWFRILDGQHKNQIIFMNQVINQGFQIHIVNELLRSMETDVEIKFVEYEQYDSMLAKVLKDIVKNKLEFALEYGENAKGYKTYKIIEVFEN